MFIEEPITVEQLEIVIHSLKRPNGGGLTKFVEEHGQELGELLELFVLPVIKTWTRQ